MGVSVVSGYSVDGDEMGEIRLREELDEDLERDIYGLGGDLTVVISNVGVVAVGEIGDLSDITGNSPNPGINTSVPNSSVKGRGGGRSTMASRSFQRQDQISGSPLPVRFKILGLTSFRNSSPAYSPSISAGPNNTVPFLKTSPSSATQLRDLLTQRMFLFESPTYNVKPQKNPLPISG